MATRIPFVAIILFFSLNASAQKLNEKYVDVSLTSMKDVEVEPNVMVQFRIGDDIKLKDGVIPRHTLFYATARFANGRMHFDINKIKVNDDVYALNLSLVGDDLMEGLPCYKGKPYIILPENSKYKFLVMNN